VIPCIEVSKNQSVILGTKYIFNPLAHDSDPINIYEFGSYTTGSCFRYENHFVTTDCFGFKFVVVYECL